MSPGSGPRHSRPRNAHARLSEIHRCRLYFVSAATKHYPFDNYTEVWDTIGEPFENEKRKSMPQGRLVAETQNISMQVVRDRIDVQLKQLGPKACCGSWRWGLDGCGGA